MKVSGRLLVALVMSSTVSVGAQAKSVKKPIFLPGASSPRNPAPPNYAPMPPGYMPVAPPVAKRMADHVGVLSSLEQFDSFASLSEGIIKGAAVKFLIDNRGEKPVINFINGNYTDENNIRPQYVQFHYYFAQKILGINLDGDTFNKSTYFTNDLKNKKFIAGTLQSYESTKDGKKSTFLGVQFYPQDAIAEETLAFAVETVRNAVQFKDLPMSVVSYGSQQTFERIQTQLKKLNVGALTVDDVYAGIPFMPMELGTAYGYLRFYPKGAAQSNLTPQDIPVFDELPLDLSVVAGVVTTVVQDAGAHVNLKSKERHTPNMVLRDSDGIQNLRQLDGKPVKLVVSGETYSVIQITEAELVKFNSTINNKPWIPVKSGTEKDILLFDEMAKTNSVLQLAKKSDSYGGKASKLSLLAHQQMMGIGSVLQKKYNYRITPTGFSIPVQYYFDFLAANPDLKKMIDDLIQHEMQLNGAKAITSDERSKKVEQIQNLFYQSSAPKSWTDLLTKKANDLKAFSNLQFPKSPIKKVKVRSSANAEDIPQFDGAGLHSSFTAKIDQIGDPSEKCHLEVSNDGVATKEEMVPATLMCAIKGVYASLWNKRAIEERNFAHIDQRTAAMGIAINTSYDFRKKTEDIKEIANAVLVTRVINSKGVYGYRISLNTDDNLVTNPTPGTQSEIVIASFLGDEKPTYSVIQHAKIDATAAALKNQLLTQPYYDRLIEMSKWVETSYCRNIPSYYPAGDCSWAVSDPEKPSSLDMEFKIFSNGEIILKQVREFSGR